MSNKWLLTLSGSLLAAMIVTGCADDQDPAPPEEETHEDHPAEENGEVEENMEDAENGGLLEDETGDQENEGAPEDELTEEGNNEGTDEGNTENDEGMLNPEKENNEE